MRICVCGVQVPFTFGGAELLVQSLAEQLRARGHEAETVMLPFTWPSRTQLFKSCLAWRLLDLTEVDGRKIDMVVATRFPSYLVKHPNKVVWLVHQLRQAYDLQGTRYSDFRDSPRDRSATEMLRAMDARTLGEARRVFAISKNVAARLERHNGLRIEALYPPPRLTGRLRPGPSGDAVFTIGRLNRMKRFDLLVRAMQHVRSGVRARIAGDGPEREALAELVRRLGVEDRVELLGWVDDERAAELYAGALAVYYAPYDEDYGYVTVEAFQAGKPVVTLDDAGGVLEFVRDGESGFVCPAGAPAEVARRLDWLSEHREEARRMGERGAASVADVHWDGVVARLLGSA
ncbi:MAG TPA: glycosyltransferase family 4 protein [Thermoanaerobaculia bacterium]|nr:glycosyltransferase family 4 protein [Thermoanaerobaculia bacterium]